MNPVSFEQLISQHRPHIERVLRDIARKYHLASAELDEFRALVDHALERNDYELLRAFDSRSKWETYLTTVVTRLFFGFQADLWGQWRPSQAAQRLGPTATLLEELMVRDSLPLGRAIDMMRTTHRVDLPRHRIEQLARDLGLSTALAPGDGATGYGDAETTAEDPAIQVALRDAMALIQPEDRLLLAMRYVDRQPLTRIAKVLKVDARPLQRRIEQAKEVLRTSLLMQGIAIEDVDAVLLQAETDANSPHRRWWMAVLPRQSH